MSTMSNPTGLSATAWTQVSAPGEAAYVTVQSRGGTPISIFIGTTVPDDASPRFHLGDNSGGNRFALEPTDAMYIRFRAEAGPSAISPTILKSSV